MAAGLSGVVVEIGFGSGLNVAAYPQEVDVVYAVEPADVARRLAEPRIAAGRVRVEHVGLDGQRIPLADNSCDGALSTFTLCTIPDVRAASLNSEEWCAPVAGSTFWSTGCRPTNGWPPGNAGSSPSNAAWRMAVTSHAILRGWFVRRGSRRSRCRRATPAARSRGPGSPKAWP